MFNQDILKNADALLASKGFSGNISGEALQLWKRDTQNVLIPTIVGLSPKKKLPALYLATAEGKATSIMVNLDSASFLALRGDIDLALDPAYKVGQLLIATVNKQTPIAKTPEQLAGYTEQDLASWRFVSRIPNGYRIQAKKLEIVQAQEPTNVGFGEEISEDETPF